MCFGLLALVQHISDVDDEDDAAGCFRATESLSQEAVEQSRSAERWEITTTGHFVKLNRSGQLSYECLCLRVNQCNHSSCFTFLPVL